MNFSSAIVVLTTVSSVIEAEKLAGKIVESKLAACVQILPAMQSIYVWENKVQRETENLLIIKTLVEKYDALEQFIKANHSYEVPEIVALSAAEISEDYNKWLEDCLK